MAEFMVKICGLKAPESAIASAESGADFVGLVLADASPRALTVQAAKAIVAETKSIAGSRRLKLPRFVALTVNADDDLVAEIAGFSDLIQFHGSESPERLKEVNARHGLGAIKAFGITDPEDLAAARPYAGVADYYLFDAKPPKGVAQQGGHGRPFDWAILNKYAGDTPFLLAGGLAPENLEEAIETCAAIPGFAGVDVSSGVEVAPGVKDDARIRAFALAARASYEATVRQ